MPRNPVGGFVSGVFGLAWGALGLVLAAWAATTQLDPAKGLGLALWALHKAPVALPWEPDATANFAIDRLIAVAIVAAVALLFAWTNLRAARIAFRPLSESHDGKGELQLSSTAEPRVGRPFEGSIRLRDAPAPGDEFDVVLSGGKAGAASAYRAEQKVRARQGAHGVSLPFRFEVPASASPSSVAYPWRLEFAPAGRRAFGRSWVDVKLAPAPAHEVRTAQAPALERGPALAPASPQAQGYVERIEKLYGALGGRLTDAQRDQIRAKLSGPEGHAMQRGLEPFRKLTPQHVKLVKYAVIGVFLLFFVMPFVFSVLGLVLAAIFG